jgi:hypothetical protein
MSIINMIKNTMSRVLQFFKCRIRMHIAGYNRDAETIKMCPKSFNVYKM